MKPFQAFVPKNALFAFLLFPLFATAQPTFFAGGTVGVQLTLGTGMNRIGVIGKGYVGAGRFQLNGQSLWAFQIRSWGVPAVTTERQGAIGVVVAWGDKQPPPTFQWLEIVGNQTLFQQSFGYAWTFYRDQIGTQQRTGTLALQLDRWQIILENDAFSFVPHDRYRTAAASLRYRLDEWTQLACTTILWHGDPFFSNMDVVSSDDRYPSRMGYKNLTGAHFGQFSHGVAAVQLLRGFEGSQQAGLQLGLDAERIRHFFQNQLIHDLPFLPKTADFLRNPHIPMIDNCGEPFLFLPEQSVRPSRFWGSCSINPTFFY